MDDEDSSCLHAHQHVFQQSWVIIIFSEEEDEEKENIFAVWGLSGLVLFVPLGVFFVM